MSKLNFVINYVEDVVRATKLYNGLLGIEPVESSPAWSMYAVSPALTFAVWARHEVQPAPTGQGGGELCVEVEGDARIATTLAAWRELGMTIIQEPVRMPFGLTFTALDPDQNRLRVFAPPAA